MLVLVLILLALWVILALVLSAWTLGFQGYIYTEATTGIAWRGPAAASAVTAFVCLWVMLDYRSPGGYRPLHEFEATRDSPPFTELRVPNRSGKEDVYKLVRSPEGKFEYRQDGRVTGRVLPSRLEKIIVIEGKERVEFVRQAERKRSRWSLNKASEALEYRDSKGRVMSETSLGQVTSFS